jgi:WD40 repeat protein
MVMAVALYFSPQLTVVTGHESGHTTVSHLNSGTWHLSYIAQPHTQPILSLDVSPKRDFYLTSSADSIIAKHVPVRVPSSSARSRSTLPETQAERMVKTKHAGQQSLRIRRDGKIFATAGWDSRIRIYSAATMKELAVLKWHQAGCFAVAFADVKTPGENGGVEAGSEAGGKDAEALGRPGEAIGGSLVRRMGEGSLREREKRARTGHWVVAGSKDGRVSLWDIY